jgi:hypothetical protein
MRCNRAGYKGKARPRPFRRMHFDTMTQKICGALYDEQAETETASVALITSLKRVEKPWQHTGVDAGTSIAHFNAQLRSALARGDRH